MMKAGAFMIDKFEIVLWGKQLVKNNNWMHKVIHEVTIGLLPLEIDNG